MNWSNSMCSDEYELRPLSRPAALLRTTGFAVALVFASAAFGADESDAPVPKPEVKVGDRWKYRRTDYPTNLPRITTYEVRVTFLGPDEILTVDTGGSGKENDSHWTSEWSAISLGGSGVVYDQPARFLKFPLKVGATHETTFEVVARRGGTARPKFEQTVKVVGWEDVVVPAGKFRALKVEAKGTFQRLDARFGGWARLEFWYVPDVKRWVKYTYEDGTRGPSTPSTKDGHELVEFRVQ